MPTIDFSVALQAPLNTVAITGNELLFGAYNRSSLPIVYNFPFTTSGVTNPVVTFYGLVTGRNNFTVTDGTVTNFTISSDLVGIGTNAPDSVVTVVKNGVFSNSFLRLKNTSNSNTSPVSINLDYGAGGPLINGVIALYNSSYVESGSSGAIRQNALNIDANGVKGLTLSASNTIGYISLYAGGNLNTNEAARVWQSGNTSFGYTGSYADNGYKLEVIGTFKATTITGNVAWSNITSVPSFITSGIANSLATPRNIALSGDIAGNANFDGTTNITITSTLPTVNSTTGTFGGASTMMQTTVNGKGQVTAISNVTFVAPTNLNLPGNPTTTQQPYGTNNTMVSTCGFVQTAVSNASSIIGRGRLYFNLT